MGKLLLLSRAFGVTADWLISDDGPDAPPTPESFREEPKVEPETRSEPQTETPGRAETFIGVIRGLVKEYGWLAGVRMAVIGGAFALVGTVLRLIGRAFIDGGMVANTTAAESSALAPGTAYYVNDMMVSEAAEATTAFSPVTSTAGRIFGGLSGVMLGIGIALLVAGALFGLTVAVRRYREKRRNLM